jgi:hypothetical protein
MPCLRKPDRVASDPTVRIGAKLPPPTGSSQACCAPRAAARPHTGNRSAGLPGSIRCLRKRPTPDFTALENVIFPAAVREGRETPQARARGRDILARMGLADRADFRSANLSGGAEAARCGLAAAATPDPSTSLKLGLLRRRAICQADPRAAERKVRKTWDGADSGRLFGQVRPTSIEGTASTVWRCSILWPSSDQGR